MTSDGFTLSVPGCHTNDDLAAQAALFRLIVENTIDVIFVYNAARARIYVSPSSQEMFGFSPMEMMGSDATILIHPDDFAVVDPHFRSVGPLCPNLHLTFRVMRRDGVYIWVEGQYRYLTENGGSVAVLRDITARKQAEQLAAQANEKLEMANRLLSSLAQQDGLTGLINRRHFDHLLEEELRRARRQEQPLAVLMIDVDSFKAYNDHFGHLRGDECLRLVSRTIKDMLRRPGDQAARYGGEEFVVVLPATDEQGAATVAERIRRAIMATESEHPGSSYGVVTISIGVSVTIPINPDLTAEQMLDAADRALYEAKAGGRNTVRYSSVVRLHAEP